MRIEPIENCFIASCWKEKASSQIVQGYEPEMSFNHENDKEKEAESKPQPEKEDEHEYIEEKQTAKERVEKIDLTDIKKLPQRNWYLSRNSFLLHGFLNYHYLVIRNTEEKGKNVRYLGVPGIYEEPERMMAMLFGFTDYIEGDEPPVGYWLCRIDE